MTRALILQTSMACAALSLLGCATDRVLPVGSECGNLTKEGVEECDLADTGGCVECRVVPGWQCNDASCSSVCGDGIAVGDEQCEPPNGTSCDSACRTGTKTEDCDMTGYWVVRETSFNIDHVISQVQTSSNWSVLALVQSGEVFHVDKAVSCGIQVSGTATVQLSDGGLRALVHANAQDTDAPPPRAPRQGRFVATADGCSFSMDRYYVVRGAEEARFLPPDFNAKPELATLTPLPREEDPQNPTGEFTDGAQDTDGDDLPGLAWRISGTATGVRNVAQRDWYEYFTAPTTRIERRALEFVSDMAYANQESILHVSRCPPLGCGLLVAGSHPAGNLRHRAKFLYLGKELADPRVSRIVARELKQDIDADLQTCANARLALAHDPAKE
ncbi:MAG TPA: DUF4215 domain-containing protein [Polyangiaceae bacterium]|nr:DUF4215 domain-containing protein [Polyangiaceae bacterium]